MRLYKLDVEIYKKAKMCYNSSMQNVFTPFCILVLSAGKNIFLGGIMSKKDYDYVVEMMRKYQEEEGTEYRIDYGMIAGNLIIDGKDGKKEVSLDVKQRFMELYIIYVETLMKENKSPLAIFMFHGEHFKMVRRNPLRRGMVYIEDDLRAITKLLPELPEGEIYVFPALQIIRSEEGEEPFILVRR